MTRIGAVEGLWRYPVKSMRGEALDAAFVGFSGVYGDRLYAFKSAAGEKGFPYLTGREQARMLLFQPRFREPTLAAKPVNLAAAEGEGPGLNPCFDDPDNRSVGRGHGGRAGIYAAVLVEGLVRRGDTVELLD